MKVLIEYLNEKIEEGDADKAIAAIDLILEKFPTDPELIAEILDPAIITNLHKALIEHLDVPPRAMQLNRRFPNAGTRAVMFVKAMKNGLIHSIKNQKKAE